MPNYSLKHLRSAPDYERVFSVVSKGSDGQVYMYDKRYAMRGIAESNNPRSRAAFSEKGCQAIGSVLSGKSLRTAGADVGLSGERVRQIITRQEMCDRRDALRAGIHGRTPDLFLYDNEVLNRAIAALADAIAGPSHGDTV